MDLNEFFLLIIKAAGLGLGVYILAFAAGRGWRQGRGDSFIVISARDVTVVKSNGETKKPEPL